MLAKFFLRISFLFHLAQGAEHGFHLPHIFIDDDAHKRKIQVDKFITKVKINKVQDPAHVEQQQQQDIGQPGFEGSKDQGCEHDQHQLGDNMQGRLIHGQPGLVINLQDDEARVRRLPSLPFGFLGNKSIEPAVNAALAPVRIFQAYADQKADQAQDQVEKNWLRFSLGILLKCVFSVSLTPLIFALRLFIRRHQMLLAFGQD